jgi:hypothetical protein
MYKDEVDRCVRALTDKCIDFIDEHVDHAADRSESFNTLLEIVAEANRLGALSPRTVVALAIQDLTGGTYGQAR